MRSTRISYATRLDASQEAEATALCAVYKFVLNCHARKEAAPESRPEARKENPNASGKPSIPRAS
jgi:hypothetical protein